MNASELKSYIYENDLLEDLLEKIGCHSFTYYTKELRCALPNETDNTKVSVSLDEFLNVRIFTKGETIYGDIYNLIMYIDNCDFLSAYRKCLALLGLSRVYIKKKNNDPLSFFKKIKKTKKTNNTEMKEYDLSILDRYSEIPHIDLIRKDGIFPDMIKKYNIRFDKESERIIFPHFKYNNKNIIVGLIGRTTNPAYEELKIPKYFPVDGIKYEKSKNLYGLSHNIDEIKKRGIVVVFEAEKSVIKADMFGYPIGVAVGSHDISDFQKKLLISLNTEIVIAFDNDVDEEHIKKLCKEFSYFRSSSYIRDKWGLLREKDAPVDRGIRKWEFLFKHRIKM